MTLAITVLVQPFVADPEFPKVQSMRQFAAVDELATAIGLSAGTTVLVFAPVDLDELAELPDSVTRRIVLVDGATVRRVVEDRHLAAAIVLGRYFDWQMNRDRELGSGLIGRKDLAGVLEAHAGAS